MMAIALICVVALPSILAHQDAPPRQATSSPVDSVSALSAALPTDSELRTGILANGLRYYIRRNDRPRKRAELRLVVDVGSVREEDDERGYAHFIEHMAFNGTEHFRKNELVSVLQSVGIRFGADLNARTGFDETVYLLPIPTDKPETVDLAFTILADWARGQVFDSAEVVAERGVVREEWRGRRGAEDRMLSQWLPAAFPGSIYSRRLPIGDEQSIMSATPAKLRAFYDRWYRPGLMAVVAVGDFDPADIERRIRARFSPLAAAAASPDKMPVTVAGNDTTVVAVANDREATRATVSLSFKSARKRVVTVGDFRERLVSRLFLQMLNDRLAAAATKPDPPFMRASAQRQSLIARDVVALTLDAQVTPAGVERGVESLMAELTRSIRGGFLESELERARAGLLARYRRAYSERGTTGSDSFAEEYVRAFLLGEASPGIDREYELVREQLPRVTLDDVGRLAQSWVTRENRLIIVQSPRASDALIVSPQAVVAALARGEVAPVESFTESLSSAPLIDALRPSGTVAEHRTIAEVGVMEWKLSNGARVLIKPTDFRSDEILLGAHAPGGITLAADKDFLSAVLASQIVSLSGLGKLDRLDLVKRLAGKQVSIAATIGETSTELTGSASVEDLETLLQLVYLEFTGARVDTAAFARFLENSRSTLAARGASPDAVFSDTVQVTMSQHAWRSRPVTEERLAEVDPRRAVEFFRERFADAGAFTFVLVGNIDTAALKPLVERYIASLPSVDRVVPEGAIGLGPPKGVVEKVVRMGLEPRATTIIVFSGPCEYSLDSRFQLRVLVDILQLRLTEALREQLGRTYSPVVRGTCNRAPRQEYLLPVQFSSSPSDADTLTSVIVALSDSLKSRGPSQAELEKVREAMARSREVDSRQNAFWLGSIMLRDRDGNDLRGILRDLDERMRTLSVDQVKQAARKYLDLRNHARFVLLPES